MIRMVMNDCNCIRCRKRSSKKKIETNTETRARLQAKEKQLEENYMSKLCDLETRRLALEIRRFK